MPLYLSFLNSGDSIPVSPSLNPLPSVCVPASLQALDKALGAQEVAGVAVLADLRDLLSPPARRRPGSGPSWGCGAAGARPEPSRRRGRPDGHGRSTGLGLSDQARPHRVPFDISGGRQQAGVISKGL